MLCGLTNEFDDKVFQDTKKSHFYDCQTFGNSEPPIRVFSFARFGDYSVDINQ